VAEFGIDNAVFAFGDQFIEVISPVQGESGRDGACARHLARHGEGGYMLILQTDSLARERTRLEALGVRRVWSAEFDDISAMHLHPKDVGAAIVSLDEPRPAASWRWGGPDWRVASGRRGAQRVLGVTLRAPDGDAAQALAARWTELFARRSPVSLAAGSAPASVAGLRVELDEGFAEVEGGSGQPAGIAGFTLAAAEPERVVEAARAAGLRVAGQRIELLGAWLEVTALP
jgi:hypothetical protein